ncbi:hypothetical protein GGF31_001339 [Allomyces arbusculus]|nr:hypothetical protein GGF31_001339 [Allomyces arbusculus]
MSREVERSRGRTKSVELSLSSKRPREADKIALRPNTTIRPDTTQQDEPLPSYGCITKGADDVLALYDGDEAEYDTVNAIFLTLQAHFPPTSARHVCLTHDRALYAHIVGDVVRLHADLTSHPPSHSLAARIRAATYFYLHRGAVAFHRPTMTRPPLVKGDPTAPAAFHHRLSLMHIPSRSPTRGLPLGRHRGQSPPSSPDQTDEDSDLLDESAADAQFDWRLACHAESVLVDLATRHGMTASIPAKRNRMWPTHSIDLAVPLPRQLLALLADSDPFPPPNAAAPEDWTQAVHDVALVAHLLALITLSRHGAWTLAEDET